MALRISRYLSRQRCRTLKNLIVNSYFDVIWDITTAFHKSKAAKSAKKKKQGKARADLITSFNSETAGFIEKEPDEAVTQRVIQENVNLTAQSKYFELQLQFGPYECSYSPNGRHIALCGRRGHVAVFDHLTKSLKMEINVMERANDVTFFHNENAIAVAQKKWTYVYDNQGVEIHCLKEMHQALRLEFLPFHFLLVAGTETGFLHYLDVSTGAWVSSHKTFLGRLNVMCQNPATAVIHTGHPNGTISMWTPAESRPVVKLLAHKARIQAIAVSGQGRHMVTSGIDRKLKLWDLRMLSDEVWTSPIKVAPHRLHLSQRGLLAAGCDRTVQIYDNVLSSTPNQEIYLSHSFTTPVHSLQFCPYEDVLGAGHGKGWASLVIPGAGEPSYDALEENPNATKKQRQEMEVKKLLAKIPSELIAPNSVLGTLDRGGAEEELERKRKALFGETSKMSYSFANKKKGKSKAGRIEKKKQKLKLERKLFESNEMMKRYADELPTMTSKQKKMKSSLDYLK